MDNSKRLYNITIYILIISIVILVTVVPILYTIGSKECEDSGGNVKSEISRVGSINQIEIICENN